MAMEWSVSYAEVSFHVLFVLSCLVFLECQMSVLLWNLAFGNNHVQWDSPLCDLLTGKAITVTLTLEYPEARSNMVGLYVGQALNEWTSTLIVDSTVCWIQEGYLDYKPVHFHLYKEYDHDM